MVIFANIWYSSTSLSWWVAFPWLKWVELKHKTHGTHQDSSTHGTTWQQTECKVVFFIISLSYLYVRPRRGTTAEKPSRPSRYSLVIAYFSQNGYSDSIFIYHSYLHSLCHGHVSLKLKKKKKLFSLLNLFYWKVEKCDLKNQKYKCQELAVLIDTKMLVYCFYLRLHFWAKRLLLKMRINNWALISLFILYWLLTSPFTCLPVSNNYLKFFWIYKMLSILGWKEAITSWCPKELHAHVGRQLWQDARFTAIHSCVLHSPEAFTERCSLDPCGHWGHK